LTRTKGSTVANRSTATAEDARSSYSQAEAAEILHVSEGSVRRYIRRRELGAIKLGNTYRIPRREVEDFVSRRQVQAEHPTKRAG